MFPLIEMEQEECPISTISKHPWADVVVLELNKSSWIEQASLFGKDIGEWPAKWFDLVRQAAIEEEKVREAANKFRSNQ